MADLSVPFALVRCERLHSDIRPDFCRQYRDNNPICSKCGQAPQMDLLAAQLPEAPKGKAVDWRALAFGQKARRAEKERMFSVSKKPIKRCACCGRTLPIIGRELCGKCYHGEKRAGRLDLWPAKVADQEEAGPVEQKPKAAVVEAPVEPVASSFAADLHEAMAFVEEFLLGKNAKYGDSVMNPVRVFSKSDTLEQINVRLDDKLSRMMRGEAAGEDTELDLLGYLIIKRVYLLRAARAAAKGE